MTLRVHTETDIAGLLLLLLICPLLLLQHTQLHITLGRTLLGLRETDVSAAVAAGPAADAAAAVGAVPVAVAVAARGHPEVSLFSVLLLHVVDGVDDAAGAEGEDLLVRAGWGKRGSRGLEEKYRF